MTATTVRFANDTALANWFRELRIRAPGYLSADLSGFRLQAGMDLQAGKITMREFGQKMKEFQIANKEYLESTKPVTVSEGNKCTATKSTIKIEHIESGDEHWWENKK